MQTEEISKEVRSLIPEIVQLIDEGSGRIMATTGLMKSQINELTQLGLIVDKGIGDYQGSRWTHKSPISRLTLLDLAS